MGAPGAAKDHGGKKLTRKLIAAAVVSTVARLVTIVSMILALKSYWFKQADDCEARE
jgi:hypothetical protein